MSAAIADRLAALGLTLPPTPPPVAAYVPARTQGSMVYTSGQIPMVDGKEFAVGKLGAEVSLEDGAAAARICALNLLSAAASVADLERLRVIKITGFVACTPDFADQSLVVNGASELLEEVLGERGKHARSAVGVPSLPRNVPVEIEGILEVV